MPLRLTPQKREFFDLFTQASANAREIARALVELLETWPEARSKLRRHPRARARGRPADPRGDRPAQPDVRHAVRPRRHVPARVARSTTSATTSTRRPTTSTPTRCARCRARAQQQAEVIHRAASRLHEAVELLEGFRDSKRQLVALRELEDEGDRLEREADRRALPLGRRPAHDHPLEGHPRAARRGGRRLRERGRRARGDPRQEP